MKLPSPFLTIAVVAALLGAGAAIGCSEPDVASFTGSGPQRGAHGSDEDEDEDEASSAQTAGDDDVVLDDDDDDTPKKKKKTEPADAGGTPIEDKPEQTQQECFTGCVAKVPEAAELNACSNVCAPDDINCLGDCYESSNCGSNPQCDQAIDQCGTKCPKK